MFNFLLYTVYIVPLKFIYILGLSIDKKNVIVINRMIVMS